MTNSFSKHASFNADEESISDATIIISERECVICYDSISLTKNMCITECGHEFCFACMMKHVRRNTGCPICRAELVDDVDSDDDSEEEDGGEDFDSYAHSDSEDDIIDEYPIENFESAFIAKGYGLKDALSLLMGIFSHTDSRYTKHFIQQLETDVDYLNDELQREYDEQTLMREHDSANSTTLL